MKRTVLAYLLISLGTLSVDRLIVHSWVLVPTINKPIAVQPEKAAQ